MFPLPYSLRSLSALLHDIFVVIVAWLLAYGLRFNFDIPHHYFVSMWKNLLWGLPLHFAAFLYFGLYQGVWRFASLPDLKRILKAIFAAAGLLMLVQFMLSPFGVIPRSVLVLNPLLLVLLMGGSRFAYRAWKEHRLYGDLLKLGRPVLILGAGEAAINLVKELSRSGEWRVIGLLDDDGDLRGRYVMGVKVLGRIAELASVANNYGVEHVIVAMPHANVQQRRDAIAHATQADLTVLTIPVFDDLLSGKLKVSQIRRVDVEDLLGRDVVSLDNQGLHNLIANKSVLVSGAGGSIGSELCRQIIKYSPKRLICLDMSEFALYQLEQEFAGTQHAGTQLIYVTSDVKNASKINRLLQQYQPSAVFHAAAYKHVPMMEQHNVAEALANNVIGTYTLAQASIEAGVEKFVLISTDKAVNPTNVMGASKRLAEMTCQGLQPKFSSTAITQFVIVRFGNVLGSSGSVIPKFRDQIAKGGPVTVTHPEITRFFMSIPEAAQLVMQAGLMGNGGEIFVLDMGQPVKIADLARDMIRLSGLHEDEIKIEYTGLRPGEKLYEELLADDEHTKPTTHPKLRIAVARKTDKAWVGRLLKWVDATQGMSEPEIKQQLKLWVEEYTQTSTNAPKPTNNLLH